MVRLFRSIKNLKSRAAIGQMAVLLVGVALSAPAIATVIEARPQNATAIQELRDLQIESEVAGTRVVLDGVQTSEYVITESADGNVLTIDLAGVRGASPESIEGVGSPEPGLSVYDGLVNQVTTSTFEGESGPTTRIEMTLAAPAVLDRLTDAGSLAFIVRPQMALAVVSRSVPVGSSAKDLKAEREAIETVLVDEAEDPWAVAETIAGLNEKGSAVAVEGGNPPPLAAASVTETHSAGLSAKRALQKSAATPSGASEHATVLRDVSFEVADGGVVLYLRADGMLSNTQAFAIEDPDRLVIDLFGVQNGLGQGAIEIGSPEVERVRLGEHDDKLRIVLDGGPKVDSFQGRHLRPTTDGLVLTVGQVSNADIVGSVSSVADEQSVELLAGIVVPAEETVTGVVLKDSARAVEGPEPGSSQTRLAWEAPAEGAVDPSSQPPASLASAAVAPVKAPMVSTAKALESPVKATPIPQNESVNPENLATKAPSRDAAEKVPTEIFGLQYDRDDTRDRIAVLADSPMDYTIFEPDSETVVLRIPDAIVSDGASEKVTPDAGGPVSFVTVFQQPDVDRSEVRVVVRRASALKPRVQRRGSILMLDFATGQGAAAPPPAFIPGLPMPSAGTGGVVQDFEALEPASLEVSSGEVVREIAVAAALNGESGTPASLADVVAAIEQPPVTVPLAQVPAPVPASLEGPAAVDLLEEGGLIDGKKYTGRRISLDFKEVLISDVLRLIAEVSDLNIIAGDEVQGTVTIRLVDVPWDQALDVILLTKGLGFVRVGNVLRIAPSEVLKVEEEVRLQERRNKEKLEDLEVKLQPVNYASVDDVANLVKRLLSPRGTVNTDVRTNTVIIKDIASVIDEATALIEAIDTQTPQVLIEAKIVEASLDFGRQLGSVWDIGTQRFTDAFNPTTPRSDLGGRDFKFQDVNNVSVGNPITSVPTGAINFGAFLLDDKMEVNVHIEAMERSGDGKVISSPRVVTLDNREAIIEQGVSIPFQTFEGGDAKLEFIDAVLSLKVTPHITADKSIIMNLEVTRNAPDSSVSTPTGSPAIAKNQAKTETLIKDGQTLVIGGIYTIDKTTRESRVPYLHKIPLLGAAFKSREISDSRKELLIFVTPRVVVNPALASAD